jgi:hypothetical protein
MLLIAPSTCRNIFTTNWNNRFLSHRSRHWFTTAIRQRTGYKSHVALPHLYLITAQLSIT